MKHLQLIVALILTGAFSFANSVSAQTTTFNADMGCAPEFYEVFVTGPWCGWCANDGTNQLTDDDGDGVYTVAIDGLSGTVEYKYAINGFADQENLINDMVDGATCAPITDYNGYANRTTEAGTTTSDYYGTCDGVCNDNPPVTVTFQVDMSDYTGTYGTVNLNGSFNGWCGTCAVMDDSDGDGVYSLDVVLNAQATVEYKFTLDGWTAQEEFAGGESCTSTIDGYTNRTLTTGSSDEVLNAVCYNSCEACTGEGGGGGGGTTETVDVTFQVDMAGYSGTYGQVNVNGSFNGWCGTCAVMTDDDADGVYSVTVTLDAGMTYEYKYTVDGWTDQESLVEGMACTSTIDGYTNRTLTTGTASETLDAVCWNSCEACATDVTMINVTWQVDMSEEGANPAGVFVAGSFQGWTAGSSQMTNDGNGVYSYTQEVEAGSFIQWKYLNGADWAFAETVPPGCGNPDDNYNRYMTLGDEDVVLDVVCFGACVACGTAVETAAVTFNVDMSQQEVSADGVHLAGNVQGWDPAATEMTDADGDGIYSVTLDLEAATYEYKFVNGNAWGFDESVPSECAVSNNRQIVVGTADMSVTYCFGQCTAGCVAPLEAADITFSVDMSQETVAESGVWVMGGFTTPAWQEGALQMSDDDGDGVYTVTASVDGPAEFQYKFSNGATMVDGVADYEVGEDADFAALGCGADNGVGGFNRTHTRSGDVETLDVVCYNSCSECTEITGLASLTFDESASADAWYGVADASDATQASISWNENGNGTGALEVSGSNPSDGVGRAYIFEYIDGAFDYQGATSVQLSFDIKMSQPLVGTALHLQTEMPGVGVVNTFDIQNLGINENAWTTLTFDFDGLDASSSIFRMHFNMAAGAFVGAGGALLIDNVTVTGAGGNGGSNEGSALTLTVDVCDATPSEVRITGPWWGWDPNGGPVASDNGDGTWSVVLDPIPTDNMEYLWVVDGVQENLIQSMVDGGTCAPITDYANYANRLWEVGSGDASSVYGSCSACETESTGLTLTVDVCDATPSEVRITGPWWGWDPNGGPVASDNGDGTWSVVLDPIPTDNMEYLWVVDGVQENLIQSMVDGGTCAPITDYANYANRLWEVGSGDASSVYGTCGSCEDLVEPVIVTVEFAIDMNTTGFPNADYDNIVINGSWNGWAGWGVTLADADGDGIFTGSLDLEEGTTFEFVIAATGAADGWSGWGSIFNAPTECEANPGLPIGQGGGNYIHTAMEGSVVAYCAGSCEATCPIPGCTDPFYTEFDMNATADDGSCATLVVFGCIYEAADNYNAAANTDDGSCEFTLNACPGDLDGDGLVATPDLLQFLSVFGTACE